MDSNMTDDNTELEALFDSIAYGHTAAPAEEPASVPANETHACASEIGIRCAPENVSSCHAKLKPINCPGDKVINSVGHLTRRLHDTLVELGYDRQLQECAAGTLPDARQRLAYVATLTEQAASRSLSAVELAAPVQEQLSSEATALASRWDHVFAGRGDPQELKAVAEATRSFLRTVPGHTEQTRNHLRDIMMAQEFQDLTGQVLKRVAELAEDLEKQLLMLLVENATTTTRQSEARPGLHGPTIDASGSADAMADQAQVDALLESLGF
jgi:chemotaxis protein CheZ